jgi:hypothetical protein
MSMVKAIDASLNSQPVAFNVISPGARRYFWSIAVTPGSWGNAVQGTGPRTALCWKVNTARTASANIWPAPRSAASEAALSQKMSS